MDPVSIALTAFNLAEAIILWMDDMNNANKFLQLRRTILDIKDVLAPLKGFVESPTLSHPSVATAIQSLVDVLLATEQDLRLWEHSKFRKVFAFLAPAKVASKLKDDEVL